MGWRAWRRVSASPWAACVWEREHLPPERLQGGSVLGGDLASVQARRGRLSARRQLRGIWAEGLIYTDATARLSPLGASACGQTPVGLWCHINFGLSPNFVPSEL